MALASWILPILIGFVASVLLFAILYNDPYIKSKFSDLGALIQLETSRPVYYGVGWVPDNANNQLPPPVAQGNITTFQSPLYDGNPVSFPIYNYFPQTPLNPKPTSTSSTTSSTSTTPTKPTTKASTEDAAFANPNTAFDAHKAYYWALSGGYPYPYPMYVLPATDMDKVRGVEDKI
jgi:hypothetical protein